MFEEMLKKYSTHTHTHWRKQQYWAPAQGPTLQRVPTEAEQTNRGGPGPREMIEPTDRRGRETSNNLQDEKIKGKRKRGKRRTSGRPQRLFSI